jgi:hypothetical protein
MQAWPGGGLGEKLDTTALLRAAAVVRHRRHIRNGSDANAQGAQGAHRRLTARTWPLDLDVEILDALVLSSATSHFRSDLSSKRRRLARTFEALATGRSPRQSVALAVGDRDDGVVERSVHVCDTVCNVLADFFADTLSCAVRWCFSHNGLSILIISSVPQRLCADPYGYGHWYVYADHAWAGRDDDGNHGSNRCPSNA